MIQSIVALTKEITNFYYVGLCSTAAISTVSDCSFSIIQSQCCHRLAYRYWKRPGLTYSMFFFKQKKLGLGENALDCAAEFKMMGKKAGFCDGHQL